MWYHRAAEQGDSSRNIHSACSMTRAGRAARYRRGWQMAQPRDRRAPPRARDARARIRDAVTTKMTRGELAQSRYRALEWAPARER